MDPLSQGVFGALWASQAARREELRPALGLGALSGMAADLDVLIGSDVDPLLQLEFHRHFTHAFAFVPVGALVCTVVLRPFFKKLSFKRAYLFAFLAFLSHGLLDAFTSYGTQLLWPFSNLRVAWDSIAIVDPFFTLPLLGLLVAANLRRLKTHVYVALAWAVLYLGLGFVQRDRAVEEVRRLAASRGHAPLRLSAKPSIGNFWLFRGLYETTDAYHADGIRVPLFAETSTYEGGSLPKFDIQSLSLPEGSRLLHDLKRFEWFSDGYLARAESLVPDAAAPYVVGDFRYAMLPTGVSPLWGLSFDPSRPDAHASFDNFRIVGASERDALLAMLFGRPLPAR